MWIISSSRNTVVNPDRIKTLQVNPIDENGSCFMVEPEEIVAYGVYEGINLIAGPYTLKQKANDVMIDIVCSMYRNESYYCPEADYKGKEDA